MELLPEKNGGRGKKIDKKGKQEMGEISR
jgi:hypothetical protein